MGNEELESEFDVGIELIIRLLGLSDTGNFRPVLGTTSFLGQIKTQFVEAFVHLRLRLRFEKLTSDCFVLFARPRLRFRCELQRSVLYLHIAHLSVSSPQTF